MKCILKQISNILISLLLFTACDSWLDVQPSDRIAEDRVFSEVSGFWGALNGVYTEMLSPNLYGGFLSYQGVEIMAQRYNITTVQTAFNNFLQHAYTSENVKLALQNYWNEAYKQILDCNNILKNAEERHGDVLNDKQYNLIKAEALALRGFLHFDLLRMFGPVPANSNAAAIPYNESISMTASAILTANEVVEKVLIDLNEAEKILREWDPVVSEGLLMSVNENDRDNDGNTYRFRGLRLNYYAVVALKARVYLWKGNTVEALKYARMIIDNPDAETLYPSVKRADVIDASNPDRAFSSEVLFSLLNEKTESIYDSYFNSSNAKVSTKLIPAAQRVMNLFGDDLLSDYRMSWWETSNSPGETDLLMNIRFRKIGNTDLVYGKLMPLIRVSEMYLIAAECATIEKDKYDYLNVHRFRRGNPNRIETNFDDELTKEYAKEFLCEGQLWFYYKRTNTPKIQSGSTNSYITMDNARYVPSLPDSEIENRN